MDTLNLNRRDFLQSQAALVVGASGAVMVGDAAAQAAAPVLVGPPPTALDTWIRIAADGSVVANFGKMDCGQGIDLAVRITADLQAGDIVRKLGACRLMTTAAPAYLALHGEPRHPRALQHHECLVYSITSSTSHWAYQVEGKLQSFAVRGRLTADNGLALLQASARGMGICLQPDFLASAFVARNELVEILHEFVPPALGIYAVLPSNRYIPHRVGVLMEHLAQALRADLVHTSAPAMAS
jgi:DNA-binding transcriptional LysR family regulator